MPIFVPSPPAIILPPEKPAIIRATDLRDLSSAAQIRERMRHATFPFPVFIPTLGQSAPAYRYYRFNFTANAGGLSGILVNEFRLFSDNLVTDISPTMTSDSAPSPYATSASSVVNSSGYGPAWEASNNSFNVVGDGWLTTTTASWWKIDMGSAVVVRAYSITNTPASITNGRAPAAWTFEGSNDNFVSDINVLDTRSGVTWSSGGQTQNFTLP